MTYRRLVRPSEFMYLRFLGATIINVLRLRGMVDADRFRAGVRRLQRAYPILDSHIVTDRSGASWYEELPTPFDGAVVPRDDDDTWRGVVDGQLTDYVDIWAGPLARITLVQGADRSEIVVAESHLASDGRGLSRQLHHLLRLMADPDLEIDPIPEVYADGKTLKAARPRLTDWSMFVRYHAVDAMYRALGAAWKLTGFTMDHDDPYMTDNLLRDVVRLEWVDLPFTQDETARLVARCRDRGVSVNSALTAAYLTIRRRLEPDLDFDRQATTVDVRRHLPGVSADQINLLASLVYTSFH
ncbi:MAG: hypothetical protein LBS56_01360, partial [Propionibacteriaceae bacterium]|nr:hypothetical protein [Propionibacteriaceae bacterium]